MLAQEIVQLVPNPENYGFIYITTNLVNGKKYLGQRSYADYSNGKKKWESYLGSGKLLMRAVKKYGRENFKKEIIHQVKTKEELNNIERYYIELYNCVESEEWYNLAKGGEGGATMTPDNPNYEEWRKNVKAASQGKGGAKLGHKRPGCAGSKVVGKPFYVINIETGESQRFESLYECGQVLGGTFYQAARSKLHYDKDSASLYKRKYKFVYEEEK